MSCGVGLRHGSDPELLCLWCRPVAIALIKPLAWEPSYAGGVTLKSQKKKNCLSVALYIKHYGYICVYMCLYIHTHSFIYIYIEYNRVSTILDICQNLNYLLICEAYLTEFQFFKN